MTLCLGGESITRLSSAAVITLAFAMLARVIRGVSTSGAVAGAVICFLLYASAGPGAFAALISVFVLAWITTRIGYQQKQALGTAEKREGRTATQVLANLSAAALGAALAALSHRPAFLLAAVAALAEAAADTVSSEIGQARSRQARLITTWEVVPAGTDGGITFVGTGAGALAAAVVAAVSVFSRLIPGNWFLIVLLSAVAGSLIDSLLGALLESRHLLNNDAVNLLGTLCAAMIALGLA